MSFNLGGILAGTLLVLRLDIVSFAPWTLAIFPGVLSMRGVIGGAFCGRLSTGLHLGTVTTSFTKNTKNFYTLWHAIITLTFVSSITLGSVASVFAILLWGSIALDSIAIFSIIIATMGLSLVLVSPLTVTVSVISYRRGLDPDVIVYPVISTTADILVTLCYILMLTVFFSPSYFGILLPGLVNLVFMCIVLYILFRNRKDDEFIRTIKESFLTLVLVILIVNVTGSFLSKIGEVVGSRPEIYTAYPAIIDTVEDVGAIVGSTATTKLHLGTIKPSISSIKQHSTQIGASWTASLFMFTTYSIIASLIRGIFALNRVLRFTAILYITNILASLFMVVIAYAVAIRTYQRGWDPDNFVIPIESSLADAITTISLLVALNLTGW